MNQAQQKTIGVGEHGSFYRLNNGELEFQPMMDVPYPTANEDDWALVEDDLVGDEMTTWKGKPMTLREAHEHIIKILTA